MSEEFQLKIKEICEKILKRKDLLVEMGDNSRGKIDRGIRVHTKKNIRNLPQTKYSNR
jgi:hypothetical protein